MSWQSPGGKWLAPVFFVAVFLLIAFVAWFMATHHGAG